MPPTAMHAFYYYICLLLPYMPLTVMHAFHYYACLLLLYMPFTAMHASHYHACQDIPTLATFFLCNKYSPTQVSLLILISYCRISPIAMHVSHCYTCFLLLYIPFITMHISRCHACQNSPDISNFFLYNLAYPYSVKNWSTLLSPISIYTSNYFWYLFIYPR
jgi:hypothetical protein